MTVVLITTIKPYIGKSTDTKPASPPAGSTFHEWNTGEIFVFDGTDWVDDLRFIYAISQGLRP